MTDDYLTTEEAAKRIGVRPSRIRQLCLSGELPAKKFGKLWMLRESDVERYVRRPPGPKPSVQK